MAEITDEGYQIKTQSEWFDEEKQLYLDIDPKWNLDPSAPDGIKLAADAETFSNLDELGQKAYNSKDPNKATGLELDIVCAITGTVRDDGTSSSVNVDLVGTNGTLIPSGSLVEIDDPASEFHKYQFAIDSDTTISGVTSAPATAVLKGAVQASIGTITKIVNPISGWQTVSNPAVATPGTEPQTDAELRVKRSRQVSLPSSNQIDSTDAAILAVEDVRKVKIYENDETSPVDANGLPIHSTAIIVDGGVNEDVAEAIYSKRNPGPIQHELSNPVTVNVISQRTGNSKTIKFNRPDYVDITVVYNIVDDGSLPANIETLIQDATIAYADGTLDIGTGSNQDGFNIGEDVQAGRFYTPANFIIGQYGNSYVSAITVNGGSTVAINFEQLSRYLSENISVVLS
jgi:uncharacterized phage protein gp47/JayE